jgi:hypothetical protein
MRCYSACGHRNKALRHYQECCKILKRELGISPLAETQALYRQINNMECRLSSDPELCDPLISAIPQASTGLEQVLVKLKAVLGDFEKMSQRLAEITRFLEKTTKT